MTHAYAFNAQVYAINLYFQNLMTIEIPTETENYFHVISYKAHLA